MLYVAHEDSEIEIVFIYNRLGLYGKYGGNKSVNKGRSVINRYSLELNGDKRFRGWKISETTVFFKD
ncbi:hypothetical protein, partial [Vibrio splendidus]|uniref:hypothetical protein n=1 Tax=Vibrio splendidus TaxID=29497 RepID=UPI001A7E0E6A